MTIKEYLSQYRQMMNEIKCLDDEIDELFSRLTSATGGYEGMPHKPTREETHTKLHAVMADMLQTKKRKREEAEDVMAEVLEVIDKVTDPVYRRLLFKRYIQAKEWCEIAEELQYVEEYVRGELHGKACNEVRKIKDGK